MFCGVVVGEKMVGGEGDVGDGVVDKCDEAAPTRGAGAVAADGGVVGEGAEMGVGGELGFL